jgi:hypothetical protein
MPTRWPQYGGEFELFGDRHNRGDIAMRKGPGYVYIISVDQRPARERLRERIDSMAWKVRNVRQGFVFDFPVFPVGASRRPFSPFLNYASIEDRKQVNILATV